MIKYLTIIFTLLLFTSCSNSDKTYTLKKTKDIKISFETTIDNLANFLYFNENSKYYITYVNKLNHSINLKNIKTDSIYFKISLTHLDSIQNTENGIAYFIQNIDSTFILLSEINTIYLIDKNGLIKNQYKVDTKKFVLQDLAPIPLVYKNKKIYVQGVRTDIAINNPKGRKIYFSTPSEIIINLYDGDSCFITNKTGCWPEIYKSELGYKDCFPSRCINNKEEVIYSFGINDSLYIYQNNILTEKIDARTKYPKNINSYPDDSNAHFTFLKKYLATETRYKSIIYDKYKNEYYRLFDRGVELENENGKKYHKWSIITLDSTFKKICETDFNSDEYNDFSIIPTNDGLLICRSSNKSDPKNILKYGLFNLVKDAK